MPELAPIVTIFGAAGLLYLVATSPDLGPIVTIFGASGLLYLAATSVVALFMSTGSR